MPRVLRIINRLNLGGPTYNAAYLTKFLAPEFETLLVSGMIQESEESSEFILQQLELQATYIPAMKREISLRDDWESYINIKRIIKKFKPDIVHTHAAKAGTLGRLAASACGVKAIVHTFHGNVFHSYFSPLKTKFFINAERFLASKSDCIIAISQKQKDELCNQYHICNAEKCKVIPLGFDMSRFNENMEEKRDSFRKQYMIGNDEIAIGIIGRITPIKNHELFIRAFHAALKESKKNIKAIIVGDGEDMQKMQQLCRDLRLSFCEHNTVSADANVIFTSWIKNVDWVIAGLDIVAMTSLNEGTPVSLIEAQAAGKPVVSTNVGGIENIIIPEITGLLSPSGDLEKFRDNLLKMINTRDFHYHNQGKKFVEKKFHYTRLVKDVRDLYHQLLKTA